MLSNLLAPIVGDGSSWSGQIKSPNNYYIGLGDAALYALIGFIVVFVGIVIIIGIIWLVGLIMRKTNNLEFLTKKREKKPKDKGGKATSEVSAKSADASSDDEIPAEVRAAIVAAIMAYYCESEDKCEFTVKRIKRL